MRACSKRSSVCPCQASVRVLGSGREVDVVECETRQQSREVREELRGGIGAAERELQVSQCVTHPCLADMDVARRALRACLLPVRAARVRPSGTGIQSRESSQRHRQLRALLLEYDSPPYLANAVDTATAVCEAVRCPVLVITGSLDRCQNPLRGPIVADLTGGELVLIEGSGHLPQARDPVKVNLLVRDFIRRV